MARIRSVHPGLFTDESFMTASAHARLLLIGIWTEAFDDGVFEWKPITLKAKIFPVDNVDVPALLNELGELNFFKCFEVNGKKYAVIRNFGKYQRPKSPNSSGVLPPTLRSYSGLKDDVSEPFPNHFRNASEIPLQMEDGGGRGEEKERDNIGGGSTIRAPAAAAELKLDKGELQRQCEQASGLTLGSRKIEVVERLVADGFDLEGRVLPLLRSISKELRDWGKPLPDTWAYFDKPIRDLSRNPPASAVQVEQVFVKKDSPEWCAIIAKKGFLADFVRERTVIADGIPGAYVAKAQITQLGAA